MTAKKKPRAKKVPMVRLSLARSASAAARKALSKDDFWQAIEQTFLASEMLGPDRSLRELQSTLPWTVHYHRDFRASPMTHKDFAHALLHVHKAAGKLAALVNDAEHAGCEFTAEQTDPYVADLVVCALRMANTCPGRTIDLQRAVIERIEDKNSVKLPGKRTAITTSSHVVTTTYDTLVGAALVQARDERGLTQSGLAAKLGFKQSRLSRVESGSLPLTVTQLSVISGHLCRRESGLLALVEHMLVRLKKMRIKVLWQRRDASSLTAKQVNAMLLRASAGRKPAP